MSHSGTSTRSHNGSHLQSRELLPSSVPSSTQLVQTRADGPSIVMPVVPKIKKRLSIDLQTKLAVIQAVDSGAPYGEVMKQFGITAKSTISSIMKHRSKFLQAYHSESFDSSRKRMRNPKFKNVDDVVLAWVKSMSRTNSQLTGPIIKAKTRSLAKQMGLEFTASDGWFDRFCKRNSFVNKLIHGEVEANQNVSSDDQTNHRVDNYEDELDDEDDEVTIFRTDSDTREYVGSDELCRLRDFIGNECDDFDEEDEDNEDGPFIGCDVIIDVPPNTVSCQEANESLKVLKDYFKRDYSQSVSLALAVLEEKLGASSR